LKRHTLKGEIRVGRLKDMKAGTRAVKRVPFPLVNVPCSLLPDIPELAEQRARDAKDAALPGDAPGEVPAPEIGLRVLLPEEQAIVYEKALAFARKRGCEKADNTDPNYNLGLSVYALALSAVDPDADPRSPAPFFGEPGDVESAAQAILTTPHLTRDGIIYLAEAQELWQSMCSPQAVRIGAQRMWELVGEVAASSDASPFLLLQPAARWIFTRFMAVQLVSSLTPKSASGPDSPESNSSGSEPLHSDSSAASDTA
jgi:hypothetical protein